MYVQILTRSLTAERDSVKIGDKGSNPFRSAKGAYENSYRFRIIEDKI